VSHPVPIRCVALIGEAGSGVSTLSRALAHHQTDIVWLDAGASSELVAGPCLAASDAVVIVVSAVQGLSSVMSELWERVSHLPTTVVVTHLDVPGADIDESAAVCRRVLGLDLHIPFLPIHDDDGTLAGFLDVLGDVIHVQDADGSQILSTDDEHRALTQAYRDELIDLLLAECADDTTVEAMAAGAHVTYSQVSTWLLEGVSTSRIHVALGFAAHTNRGDIGLDLIAAHLDSTTPALSAHQLPVLTLPDGDPTDPLQIDGPAVALVLGRDAAGTCCRVLGGTISDGDLVMAVSADETAPVTVSWTDATSASAGSVVHTTHELAAGTTLASLDHIVMVESG